MNCAQHTHKVMQHGTFRKHPLQLISQQQRLCQPQAFNSSTPLQYPLVSLDDKLNSTKFVVLHDIFKFIHQNLKKRQVILSEDLHIYQQPSYNFKVMGNYRHCQHRKVIQKFFHILHIMIHLLWQDWQFIGSTKCLLGNSPMKQHYFTYIHIHIQYILYNF